MARGEIFCLRRAGLRLHGLAPRDYLIPRSILKSLTMPAQYG